MNKQNTRRAWRYVFVVAALLLAVAGFAVPETPMIPVSGARTRDWHPKSFWYEPWGAAGVHKGIDIFAQAGVDVLSATPGLVLYQGQLRLGGNIVAVLGPKWRIHYYAHLADGTASLPWFVSRGERIGKVGTTGNAVGKPPHLHYSVMGIVPLPWRFSTTTQGWLRMFYVDPGALFRDAAS